MSNAEKYDGPSPEWLRWAGELEDRCRSVAVGGLAADLGVLELNRGEGRRVFGRLITYARRQKGLSVEALAEKADVGVEELLEIERNDNFVPELRTAYQLAQVLGLPAEALLELAGLAKRRQSVNQAALRFAARSESTTELSDTERAAFEEFVSILVDATDKE